ncbi:hypothetical protein K1719_018879 [Acacia pycnantha]|nr:hypothetical protein K1719_018879 [Acacia pycnantha]
MQFLTASSLTDPSRPRLCTRQIRSQRRLSFGLLSPVWNLFSKRNSRLLRSWLTSVAKLLVIADQKLHNLNGTNSFAKRFN